MLHTVQVHGIAPGTTIAAGDTVTGPWLDLGSAQGTLSITLYDKNRLSTSQDITYEKGIMLDPSLVKTHLYQELADKLLAVTPADGGSIGTGVDCSTAQNNCVAADPLTLPDGKYFRFKVKNNLAMDDALDYLIIEYQI